MNPDERDEVAARFGVAQEQVERDHLISHLLAAASDRFGDRLHFIGGTALARTHLVAGRLSEDIDLVALGSRAELAADLDRMLPRAVTRSHGRLTTAPGLAGIRDTEAAFVRTDEGLSIKVQLLSSRDRTVWPTELRPLEQRYSDAPLARLLVPTLPAFAAAKTATWHDRRAPRDVGSVGARWNRGHRPGRVPPLRALRANESTSRCSPLRSAAAGGGVGFAAGGADAADDHGGNGARHRARGMGQCGGR
ncbi:nucleotidyl transferase AbiEii/AbiGii toxin family protein [Nocardia jiangsuensis]|uniref:Nucleotidyl transferase AbiEii/AbiGii toxin family protein n=1 Tax=Nocardia jiangsuensis TaxID=1691563 RepID=A0ABV8E194_9NOCA